MDRKSFLLTSGMAGLYLYARPGISLNQIITARDLQEHLRSLHPVDEPSVDRIVIGDPETKIRKIATAWMPYLKTLEYGVSQGVNVFVVHEPAFYDHWDLEEEKNLFNDFPGTAKEQYRLAVEKKKKWIDDNRLVIIRSHDVPDILKETGMPFALGQKLGLSSRSILRSRDYYNVYQVTPDTAINHAERIAKALKDFGQPGVAFYGDPGRQVSSLGIGTGCICDPAQFADLDPDMVVAIDDTIRTWIQTTYSEDTGKPLIVINHGTSEEMGMRLLNKHLKTTFPDFECIHIDQGCGYRWVS